MNYSLSNSGKLDSSLDFHLAPAPSHLTGAVKAWSDPLSIHSAVHIENELIRLLILPDRGGSILAIDKATGTELFERPAGLSFVWPRPVNPDALLPVSTKIEEHPDGSRTVWCSRYDSLTRMKGMHGICLYPGRSYVQVKVRLYNRTPLTQTYVWRSEAAPAKDGALQLVHVAANPTVDQTGFAYLAPYETRSFSEHWYAIASTHKSAPVRSNVDATASLSVDGDNVRGGVYVTHAFTGLTIRLMQGKAVLAQWSRDLMPGLPFIETVALPAGLNGQELSLVVLTSKNRELIRFEAASAPEPDTTSTPPAIRSLQKAKTVQELYLTGLYLDGNRNKSPFPEEYWQEALRRDSDHVGSNNALGLWHLRRGDFVAAETYFRRASLALTSRNQNPQDTEPLYHLGLTLRFLDRDDEAYHWLTKACGSFAWQSAAYLALAEIDVARGRPEVALDHLRQAIRVNTENLNARNLTGAILRRFGAVTEANRIVSENVALDPLDGWSQFGAGKAVPDGNQVRLDIAFDLADAGLIEEAIAVLKDSDRDAQDGSGPMSQYALGDLHGRLGRYFEAHQHYEAAAQTSVDNCSPYRLQELRVLERAVHLNEQDAKAPYLLGVLLDALGRLDEGIDSWEESAGRDPDFPEVWRKLGIAQRDYLNDPDRARQAYDKAWELDSSDAQTFYERDQLWRLTEASPSERLAEYESTPQLVRSREDLAFELAALYNQVGRHEDALAILQGRTESVQALLLLGQRELRRGLAAEARGHFDTALAIARDLGVELNEITYWLGETESVLGHSEAAREFWTEAARPCDIAAAYYRALALDRLGHRLQSRSVLRRMVDRSRELRAQGDKIEGVLLEAQARVGLGQLDLARRLLGTLLSLDPGNLKAASLLSSTSSPTRDS